MFQRQTILPGIGPAGLAKLTAARVLIVGCGGLGVPAALYLAGAGVGTLSLVDGDKVSETNLHRQVIYRLDDVGEFKAKILAKHCSNNNPCTRGRALNKFLDASNIKSLVHNHDLVLDCTDDPWTKHALSDACYHLRTPLVHAAAQGFSGCLAVFPMTGDNPVHLRDLHPTHDPDLPDCATTGVLGTAVGTIGLLQANAALCHLLGIGAPPYDSLLTYDALDNRQLKIRIAKNHTGPVPRPWSKKPYPNQQLERTSADPAAYAAVFSMLTPEREPELLPGAERLPPRNPFGACQAKMEPGKPYLLYCNSGKLSLVLAAQLQREGLEVYSLAGGIQGLAPTQ